MTLSPTELPPEANMEPELLPCPCCGSTEIDAGDFDGSPVYCLSCFLRALSPERWNRRPQPDLSTDRALVEELARELCQHESGDPDALSYLEEKPVWTYYVGRARAILPILKRELAKAKAVAEAANQRAAHAEHRLYSFRQGRAARSKVMADFIKANAPELWPDYAALSVNGSLYSDDLTVEPVYEREMNTLRHRAETAEERATASKADAEMLAGALGDAYHEGYRNGCEDEADGVAHKDTAAEGFQNWLSNRPALASYREKN